MSLNYFKALLKLVIRLILSAYNITIINTKTRRLSLTKPKLLMAYACFGLIHIID